MVSLGLMQGDATQGLLSFLPLILIFGIFYFLVIAPARKRQKQLQATVDALEKGDRIVTNGGIYGEVVSIDGGKVILKIADNVRIKIAKSAVAGLEGDPAAEDKS